jgi:hypothetical protein
VIQGPATPRNIKRRHSPCVHYNCAPLSSMFYCIANKPPGLFVFCITTEKGVIVRRLRALVAGGLLLVALVSGCSEQKGDEEKVAGGCSLVSLKQVHDLTGKVGFAQGYTADSYCSFFDEATLDWLTIEYIDFGSPAVAQAKYGLRTLLEEKKDAPVEAIKLDGADQAFRSCGNGVTRMTVRQIGRLYTLRSVASGNNPACDNVVSALYEEARGNAPDQPAPVDVQPVSTVARPASGSCPLLTLEEVKAAVGDRGQTVQVGEPMYCHVGPRYDVVAEVVQFASPALAKSYLDAQIRRYRHEADANSTDSTTFADATIPGASEAVRSCGDLSEIDMLKGSTVIEVSIEVPGYAAGTQVCGEDLTSLASAVASRV